LLAQEVDLSEVGHTRGEAEAPIAVVEFGDFACGACALFHDTTWPQLDRDYVQTGRVVWRHVPFVLGFRRGDDATKAGECAAVQGAYWGMHDRLFGHQDEWKEGSKHKDVFFRYALELGLDEESFRECYDKNRGKDRTKQANRAAKDLGVRATPTFFIDGFRVQGALSVEAFAALLEEAAARREANGS
jgi:protein-disulfide isomerase